MIEMREKIWKFTRANYQCLIALAEDIALGIDPHPSHGGISLSKYAKRTCPTCTSQACPQPINYLVNSTAPSVYNKDWIHGGSFKFTACDVKTLTHLALVKGHSGFVPKTLAELCGFNTGGVQGLSILLGPWSDYCLWCWAQHPNLGSHAKPVLVLGKDNDIFSTQTIYAGRDWGADQVADVEKIKKASDPSTRHLFGAIEELASSTSMTISEFIAENRIFIYNVWPWFRCGNSSTGSAGIHSNFNKIESLWHWLDMLIQCLKPQRIATLGGWSWDADFPSVDGLLRKRLPTILNSSAFPSGTIDVFRHPSARSPTGWFDPWLARKKWNSDKPWGEIENNAAFKDFIDPTVKPGVILEGRTDE